MNVFERQWKSGWYKERDAQWAAEKTRAGRLDALDGMCVAEALPVVCQDLVSPLHLTFDSRYVKNNSIVVTVQLYC